MAKSHFENINPTSDFRIDVTSEGNNNQLAIALTGKDGKVEHITMVQPKNGGKVTVEGNIGNFDNVTVEVPDDHHWIYNFSGNGNLIFTRRVTLSADGKAHEAKSTRMHDGKKVVENEYMVKAN